MEKCILVILARTEPVLIDRSEKSSGMRKIAKKCTGRYTLTRTHPTEKGKYILYIHVQLNNSVG